MIRISFKEAQYIGFENLAAIKIEDGEITYYRNNEPVYCVRYWISDDDYAEKEFQTLKEARKYAKKYFKDYDINYYKDKTDHYWTKQWQYTDGELIGEEKQNF